MDAAEYAPSWPSFTIEESATSEQREALERFRDVSQTYPEVLLNALSILSMHNESLSIYRLRLSRDIAGTVDTVKALLDTRADTVMDLDPQTEAEINRDPVIAGLRQQQHSMGSNSLSGRNPEAKERLRDQFRLRNLAIFAGRAVIAHSITKEHLASQKQPA